MIFLQDALHADLPALGRAYLPAALISSFLPAHMGWLADRLGRKIPMMGGLLVGALASALIPHLPNVVWLAVLWAVESVGCAAATPAERAFVADIAGEDMRGSSYGLYTFAYFLGGALGPLAGGWLYDNVGRASPFISTRRSWCWAQYWWGSCCERNASLQPRVAQRIRVRPVLSVCRAR